MKLTKLANLVYEILSINEEARDDDDYLVYGVWCKQADRNIWEIPMGDFYLILKNEWNLSSDQTIRRTRRKVQQHYPDTRGKKYVKRMLRQEDFKSNLKLVAAESTNPNYS